MTKVTTDPIADMLSRVRNAVAVRKSEVRVPYSKVKEAVANLLASSTFIDGVKVEGEGIDKALVLQLMEEYSNSSITEIKRLSTPGRRMYVNADKIPTVKRGRGLVIISTSKGLMTGSDAKAKRLGGELICSVY